MNIYEGDPAIQITVNGADFKFIEGQPVMDQGFENAVLISLFTEENWIGNDLFNTEAEQIGSSFLASMKLPHNREGIIARRNAALNSLEWLKTEGLFKDVFVSVTNPSGSTTLVNIRITPPNGEDVNLTLDNFGPNWRLQRDNPAHRRF